MIAAQKSRGAASVLTKKVQARVENQMSRRQEHLKKMNPNVDVP